MRILGLFFTLVISFSLEAQDDIQKKMDEVNNLFSYGQDIMQVNGVEAAIDSLLQFEETVVLSKDRMKISLFNQTLMTFYSFIDYKKSLLYESKSFPNTDTSSIDLPKNFIAVDAAEYIVKTFGSDRVILINEAHNCSQNRAFVRDLLPALRKAGFNYLLLEALFEDLGERGYPILTSGLYLNDPVFGQLVRVAKQEGFQVLKLENEDADDREFDQMTSILKILNEDLTAKIVVLVGHDHILKKQRGSYVRMGKLLVDSLKHDVPSFELTYLREKYDKIYENPFYRAAVTHFSEFDKPFVLLDNNEPFASPNYKGFVNFNVVFPRTQEVYGLPNWSIPLEGKPYTINVDFPNANFYKIHLKNEFEKEKNNAVPYIQGYVKEGISSVKVRLPKGAYLLQILDKYGNEVYIREIDSE